MREFLKRKHYNKQITNMWTWYWISFDKDGTSSMVTLAKYNTTYGRLVNGSVNKSVDV